MSGKIVLLIIILVGIGAFGYTLFRENVSFEDVWSPNAPVVTSGDDPLPGSAVHDLPVPLGVSAARKALAERLSIPEKNVLILEVQEKDFPDACLGISEEGVMCAQVITPGFDVHMRAQQKEYHYRVNTDGTVVREVK